MSRNDSTYHPDLRGLLADRVRLYRCAAEMSQGELGLASGVDQSYISEIERGLAMPGAGVVMDLCHALVCEPNDLLLP